MISGTVDPDQYRYPGESDRLLVAVGVLFIILFGLMAVSLGFVLGAVLVGLFYVRTKQGQLLGNAALVTPRTFARVHSLAETARRRLGMPMPRVHVAQDPYLNAFALGFSSPHSVVLHSALVHELDDQELLFVLGHEFGHIKAGHTRWLSVIAPFGSTVAGFDLIFGPWSRRAEYTSDRAGLIACRDLDGALRAIIKVSAGPRALEHTDLAQFLEQAKALDTSEIDRIGELFIGHPYTVNRIRQLIDFYHSPTYRQLAGADPQTPTPADADCPGCAASRHAGHRFCTRCGRRLAS